MIPSSDCPPWPSDRSGARRKSPRRLAQLHHASGHDQARPEDERARQIVMSWLGSCAFGGGKEQCGGPSRCPQCSREETNPKPPLLAAYRRKRDAVFGPFYGVNADDPVTADSKAAW